METGAKQVFWAINEFSSLDLRLLRAKEGEHRRLLGEYSVVQDNPICGELLENYRSEGLHNGLLSDIEGQSSPKSQINSPDSPSDSQR
jgi:hypothetical protein